MKSKRRIIGNNCKFLSKSILSIYHYSLVFKKKKKENEVLSKRDMSGKSARDKFDSCNRFNRLPG